MPLSTQGYNSKETVANAISFSFNVRDEMARNLPERKCCREAMLASFLFSGAHPAEEKGEKGLVITTGFSRVARLIYRLMKDLSTSQVTWQAQREKFLGKRKVYQVFVPSCVEMEEYVNRWGIREGLQRKNIRKACCRRAFLAGAFMAAGSVNSPERYYHFEIVQKDDEIARFLVQVLARMEIRGKVTGRKKASVVYVKRADEIANLLNILGAHTSLLKFEEVRAIKETKEEVRRRVNGETANLDKTARAAIRQVHGIRRLKEMGFLEKLPEKLRKTAELRLRFPSASFKELGERLTPPLTKSSVSNRLRRLENICHKISGNDA